MAYRARVEPEGAPLTVCINDCALDHGQPNMELAPVCFRLGCAFAEARWRVTLAKHSDIAHLVHIEVNQSAGRIPQGELLDSVVR